MKPIFLLCFLPLFALTSCGGQGKILEHPAPDLKFDISYFADQGCFGDLNCSPEGFIQPDPPITMIQKPSDLLGALSPKLPLAVGSTVLYRDEEKIPAVFENQCMRNQLIRYLVRVNDQTILVDSVDGMARLFSPIDSADEALSYAIATTGKSALYDLETIRKIKLYSTHVEETFVKETDGGYVVHLFQTYLCGCGPHIVKYVDVTVHMDGTILVNEPVDAYSDPEYDGLCID